jgi:hypothetical protein
MAGPYDYTVNIPQPPAQNFLQSLMGIRQLQQMEEQSALQQQQAGYQQQQAQFAQEMRPLQLQAERERINQIKAATGATQTSQQAAAYQLQQRKDLDAELLGISSDPTKFTADNIQRVALKFHNVDPTLLTRAGDMRKSMSDQTKIFGDNVAKNLVLTSVTGDSEAAIKQLDKELEAAKNTPGLKDYVPKLEQLRDNFIKYPDQTVALAAVGQTLFAPDNAKAITDVLAKQAEIKETQEKTKKEKAATENQLLDNRIKQYEADNGISLKDIQKNKEERFKAEAAERVHIESQPFVRQYLGKREAFDMMKTAEPTGVGDKVLLVQFTKMGDPTSIVSVTEEGSSRNITVSDYIASLEARIKSTGSLGDQQRKELKDQAFQMLKTSEKAYKEYKDNLLPAYTERGLNPKNIFVLPSSEQLREDAKKQAAESQMSPEEQRMRSLLRPAAGFGNTMTPSQIPFQGGTFQGRPTDVDAILKQLGVQ